jgi:hypothetical protein
VVIGERPFRVCGVDKHRQEGSQGFTSSWYSLAGGKVYLQENSR